MPSSSSKSNSSRSSQSSKKKSRSKSIQKRKSRQKSHQKDHKRRSNQNQRRRSPGRGVRRNADLIPKSSKLFITNIDSSIKQDQLKTDIEKQFTKFGKIKQITIKTKSDSRNSFVFVQYQNPQDAEAALKQMKGKQFKGKQLKVQFGKGQRKQQDRRADKCYICHKQGHFAKDCRYRDRSRDRRDSKDYSSSRRRKYSRSSSSSRSYRRRRSNDRDRDRDYRRRDRDYRRSPDRKRQYRYEKRY